MAAQWFYTHDTEKRGPVSTGELKELAARGTVRPTDTVWKEGVIHGVLAAKVKGLFAAVSAPATQLKENAAAPPPDVSLPRPDDAVALVPEATAKLDAGLTPAHTPTLTSGNAPPIIPDSITLTPIPEDADLATAATVPVQPTDATSPLGASAKRGRLVTPTAPKVSGRAFAVKGATITSQDGATVYFRKKCTRCGHEDVCRSSMRIRSGTSRESFFCPKCRKTSEVIMQGIT